MSSLTTRSFKISILILLLITRGTFASAASQGYEATQPIRYFQTGLRHAFVITLLKLVLDETNNDFGPYQLQAVTGMNELRGKASLIAGVGVDVMISPVTACMLERLRAVPIPLERGLLGYRLLLVNENRAAEFANITTLEELNSKFTAGFNKSWIDHQILEFNQIPTVTSAYYQPLFKMLAAGRFDYFPRGINEAADEKKAFEETFPSLTIEPELALYYPYPRIFFVHKNNAALADRLETGLKRIRSNGLFQKLFERVYRDDLKRAKISQRRVIQLENPLLPNELPEPDTSSWLPPDQLIKPPQKRFIAPLPCV